MRNLKGFALLIFATGLIIPLTVINRNNVRENNGDTDGYFRDTAINIDIWANREFRATWNKELITNDGYQFGNENETISEVLWVNFKMEKLSKRGMQLYKLIQKIYPKHFEVFEK